LELKAGRGPSPTTSCAVNAASGKDTTGNGLGMPYKTQDEGLVNGWIRRNGTGLFCRRALIPWASY